jgi:hypothetical protein
MVPSTGTKTNVSSLDILRFVPRQPIELRARTRIFESRNGEGIPSVTQRE